MKKMGFICALLAALLLFAGASAEMVSIAELHDQAEALGGRWKGTYETPKGTLEVNAPIIVPDVETMPVITVERAKPLTREWFDALEAEGRTGDGANELEYQSDYDGKFTEYILGHEENGLSGYDAVNSAWAQYGVYLQHISKGKVGKGQLGPIEPRTYHYGWALDPDQPNARDIDMTINTAMELLREDFKRFYPGEEIEVHPKYVEIKGSLLTENPDKGKTYRIPGEYKLHRVEQYMNGLPVIGAIKGLGVFHGVDAETRKNAEKLEAYGKGAQMCQAFIGVYGQDAENYRTLCEAIKLRTVEIADVPLASLEQVMKCIEKEIEKGQIKDIYALRLGYVLYSNPDMPDYAWAIPRWVMDCTYTTEETELHRKYDISDNECFYEAVDFFEMPIDAQSGEPIIFATGTEEIFSVPKMITWNDVN